MEKLEIFSSDDFGEIRIVEIQGEPWFAGRDVAEVLGYVKPLNALATHVDEDDSLKQGLIDSMGRIQETIFINESGLYSLILSSKLPNAKKFKKWVTSEVLPAIRKTGTYSMAEKLETQLADERRFRESIENRLESMEKMLSDMRDSAKLTTEVRALPKLNQASTKLPKKGAVAENEWYAKNKERILKACREYEVTHSDIYHSILQKCSEQYDLDLAKEIYYNEVGGYPKYMMDLVVYFPELEEIADKFLYSIR